MKLSLLLCSICFCLLSISCTREYNCVCTSSSGRTRIAASAKITGLAGLAKGSVKRRCKAEATSNESCELVRK